MNSFSFKLFGFVLSGYFMTVTETKLKHSARQMESSWVKLEPLRTHLPHVLTPSREMHTLPSAPPFSPGSEAPITYPTYQKSLVILSKLKIHSNHLPQGGRETTSLELSWIQTCLFCTYQRPLGPGFWKQFRKQPCKCLVACLSFGFLLETEPELSCGIQVPWRNRSGGNEHLISRIDPIPVNWRL